MTDAKQSDIDLDRLLCPECGAAAKRIITWAYNPHPEHGVLAEGAHGIGGPASIQLEFECDNGHIKFERDVVLQKPDVS